jgi:nitric oxide reductase large subunit
MTKRINTRHILMGLVIFVFLFLHSVNVKAHCDTLDGPVIESARHALDAGDVTGVLIRYYTDLFKNGHEDMALQPGIVRTDEQGAQITAFFGWLAWAAGTQRLDRDVRSPEIASGPAISAFARARIAPDIVFAAGAILLPVFVGRAIWLTFIKKVPALAGDRHWQPPDR